jgi:hypothetical protein
MQVTQLPLTGVSIAPPIDFARAGMPSLDTVHDAVAFTPVPGGPTYQVLRTTEFDSYDAGLAARTVARLLRRKGPPSRAALEAALGMQPALSDNFQGTARKAAKLSIAQAATEQFKDVRDLIASLAPESDMINHKPPIGVGATSDRVNEEKRNVGVTAFLYAASRESDNDFHLIVGRNPAEAQETYMTMEVSGLPPTTSAAFNTLKAARDSFQGFFKSQLPQLAYDFYHPPIPVVVEGSIFFDMSHSSGQRPGPPSLKSRMPTIWEVHPVTAITLGP